MYRDCSLDVAFARSRSSIFRIHAMNREGADKLNSKAKNTCTAPINIALFSKAVKGAVRTALALPLARYIFYRCLPVPLAPIYTIRYT